MLLTELKDTKPADTEFQVKTYGQWEDVKLPVKDLDEIVKLVSVYGAKGSAPKLNFLANLVRDNWGRGAFRNRDGSPSDFLNPDPNGANHDHKLKLGKFEVVDHSDDVLELKLHYDLLRDRGAGYKSETKGFTPVKIMPSA